jgi:hypothetical protein
MGTLPALQIDIRALLTFFDERPPDSRRHASAIVAVLGEDLACGLLKMSLERKHGCTVKTVMRSGRPSTPTTGDRTGPRLDRWLIVENCPLFPQHRAVLQTEIKNYSAHAIGGKVLSTQCKLEELDRYGRSSWTDNWSAENERFKDDKVGKVLTRMKPPTHIDGGGKRPILIDPPITSDEIEPLLCFWVVVHPEGKGDPLVAHDFARGPINGFRRVWIFSMSSYLRSLTEEKVTIEMPTAAPRLAWLRRICGCGLERESRIAERYEAQLPAPMRSASFDDVCARVRGTYECAWRDWYSALTGVSMAMVEITQADHSAGYIHSRNLIVLSIPEANLEDPDILDRDAWPSWRIDLVHEMLHEWQKKKPCLPTPDADALFQRHGPASSGEGHGPDFFQALLEKAPYFAMTAEQLLERIG